MFTEQLNTLKKTKSVFVSAIKAAEFVQFCAKSNIFPSGGIVLYKNEQNNPIPDKTVQCFYL